MRTWFTRATGARPAPGEMPPARSPLRVDMEQDAVFMKLLEACQPFTLTTPERLYGLAEAVRYLVRSGLAGDLVECGVWRGGSMVLCASLLRELGAADRGLWLYDTFAGMPPPGEEDVDLAGRTADDLLAGADGAHFRCEATLEDVQDVLARTNYPPDQLHFVAGKVEETLPGRVPERIALLRLDTDWYASTLHELEHLYPRLVPGGVLLIDDYGHWQGARQAVDEFFAARGESPLLTRLDYSCRLMVKVGTP